MARDSRLVEISSSQYLAQAMSAAAWERAHHRNLLMEGWVYDDELRRYTHPEKPETVICIG
jgi:hypothetical protein